MSQRLSACGKLQAAEERNLFHLLTVEALEAAFLPEQESGRRSGWHQVDGLRRKHEEQHNRSAPEAHQGAAGAQPGRRHYIPKRMENNARSASPRWRTKIVQYALVKILNTVYENDFMGFSYGLKPARYTGRTDRAGTH